ncbi:MAG: ATP-binding cassette domain-containing protein [Candidatus Eisenbacteria bacterium]|uniref:ATP-binding cassette domain-containing protein n=1 Tax=Eiseniibacteriota bacterium TaxID=2212470 RepID=A0A956M1X1_UNCEI|nr:ATP-binding cassette domain-containing protein [Candidatus Eisenbacteria bacterium]
MQRTTPRRTVSPVIELERLSKSYVVPVREAGVRAGLISIVKRKTRQVDAVKDVSLRIDPGEIVGFLGPNGAGKTTTLKMLSGLLHPTAGEARVLGHQPWRRENELLRQITLVMGQRNQLIWDIPVIDSFDRNRVIYRLSRAEYQTRVEELTELLDLSQLLTKPVRNLSLGERMKCEVAAALLHHPRILFLDEPTLGLDVSMQRRLRSFVAQYNRQTGAAVLLTSHYMADVEALCPRVVVIHHGEILFDGKLGELVKKFSALKTIVLELEDGSGDLSRFGEVVSVDGSRVTLRIPKQETAEITGRLLRELKVHDLTVADPPIDEVIDQVFTGRLA